MPSTRTRTTPPRRAGLFVALAALAVLLSACTVYVVPGEGSRVSLSLDLNEVITTFAPARGAGSTYLVGERIEFQIRTRQDGYVTLTAIDPDGSVYVFARNIRVAAGRTQFLSGPGPRLEFAVTPPTGLHRVRAAFTAQRTDQGRVRYEGRSGEEGWTTAIRVELESAEVRDVAQTHFFVRRR
jgi:hypothetical protein